MVAMIVTKRMERRQFLVFASFHGILMFGYFASLILQKNSNDHTVVFNYFFLAFICSGIILSGLSLRSDLPKWMKLYFSGFALAIPLFIFSPSMLVNFLLTAKYTDSFGPRFDLGQRYFLETQNTVMTSDSFPHYKLIRKKGMFHETIERDIVFRGILDSVKILEFNPPEDLTVRAYTSNITFVSSVIDSTDKVFKLRKIKKNDVEYRLN